MPLPILQEQWMSMGSSFVLLSWQATFFSLGWTRSDFYQLCFWGEQMKSALTTIPQFTFLSAIRTVIRQPHQVLRQSLLPPLNSVKVPANKGCTPSYSQHIHSRRRASSPARDCQRGCVACKGLPCWTGQCFQGSLLGVTAGVPVTHTVTSQLKFGRQVVTEKLMSYSLSNKQLSFNHCQSGLDT